MSEEQKKEPAKKFGVAILLFAMGLLIGLLVGHDDGKNSADSIQLYKESSGFIRINKITGEVWVFGTGSESGKSWKKVVEGLDASD